LPTLTSKIKLQGKWHYLFWSMTYGNVYTYLLIQTANSHSINQ